MSKLKDKLSENMRTIKATQGQTASQQAKETPVAPNRKSLSGTNTALGRKPAGAVATAESSSKEVPQSGTELFPSRVWPD